MIIESTISAIAGGVFRLAPELLKAFDRKNERAHELAMQRLEIEITEKQMAHQMRQVDAAMSMAELSAVTEAIKEQGQTARAAGRWVAGISALVRPLVTYWFVVMYSLVKIVSMMMAVDAGADWKEVITVSWKVDDMSMLTMVLTFWFVGRIYERAKR